MDCLTNIIGVTNSDCPCIIGGLTEEQIEALRLSTSGLYLDDLPGGLSLTALDNLDWCKDMAQMALDAIRNATKQLEGDLVVALNNRYTKAKGNFIGNIGLLTFAGTMAVTKQYQGIVLRSREASDALMTVNKIFITLNAAVTTEVKIIRALTGTALGEVVATFEVTTGANTITTINTPDTILPLSINGNALDYYVVYDRMGALPKDNKLDCNCSKDKTKAFDNYLTAQGVQLDSLDNLTENSLDKKAHGLVMDVVIKCNNAQLICREYDNTEAIAQVLAYATWYKAGELLIESVMKSTEVNRFTTMNKEYLWGKRNHFRAQYEGRVNYLSTAIDVTSSSCFICKDTDFVVSAIMATNGHTALYEDTLEAQAIAKQTRGDNYNTSTMFLK